MRATQTFVTLLVGAGTAVAVSLAQPVVPESLPDPGIAGFRFPETEAAVSRWTMEMTRGVTPGTRAAAAAQIHRHGWGLWAALTQETSQSVNGQRLRIFETWLTPDDLLAASTATSAPTPPVAASARTTVARQDSGRGEDFWNRRTAARSPLQPLGQLQSVMDATPSVAAASGASPIGRIAGFVKYNPTAADHITRQELFRLSTLDLLLQAGAQQIPPFPADALVAKPVFQIVRAKDLVAGRYYALRVWSGPPATPQPWGPAQWTDTVWLDVAGGGEGSGAVDPQAAVDGSSRTEATTYPLAAWIYYRLSAADAAGLNAAKPGTDAAAGDLAVLVAMHASTRETARWTWQTYWWTPAPDAPPAPSSAAVAGQRPRELRGAAAHYAMAVSYSMVTPDQPFVGGSNAAPAVYAYNPWIEARLGPAELPDSRAGLDPAGLPAANNLGVQSNCMSCHAQANHNPRRLPTAPRATAARYVDLGAAEFVGTLQVDFLWSLPRHAR